MSSLASGAGVLWACTSGPRLLPRMEYHAICQPRLKSLHLLESNFYEHCLYTSRIWPPKICWIACQRVTLVKDGSGSWVIQSINMRFHDHPITADGCHVAEIAHWILGVIEYAQKQNEVKRPDRFWREILYGDHSTFHSGLQNFMRQIESSMRVKLPNKMISCQYTRGTAALALEREGAIPGANINHRFAAKIVGKVCGGNFAGRIVFAWGRDVVTEIDAMKPINGIHTIEEGIGRLSNEHPSDVITG